MRGSAAPADPRAGSSDNHAERTVDRGWHMRTARTTSQIAPCANYTGVVSLEPGTRRKAGETYVGQLPKEHM